MGCGSGGRVSALLTASTIAYTVVRIAGAAYMIWLGSKMLWSAVRDRDLDGIETSESTTTAVPVTAWASWRRGLLTNLLNPKMGAFYVAVLPQFIPAGASHLAVGLLLALVHDAEGMLWFTAVIFGAQWARRWLTRRSARRAIDGVTGTVLVGFGLKLSLSTR